MTSMTVTSIPVKATGLLPLDAPAYLIVGRDGDGAYGRIDIGSISEAAAYTRPLESFGAITGTTLATDMATWNAALTWAKANRGTIVAPPGKSSLISSLNLVSWAKIDLRGHTLLVSGAEGLTQPATGQLYDCHVYGGRILPATPADAGAVAFDMGVMQDCFIDWPTIENFTAGTAFRTTAAVLTSVDYADTKGLIGSSNTIRNRVYIKATDCANGMDIVATYGTTPTGSPANSSNVPRTVGTKNDWKIYGWSFTGDLVHLRSCVDGDDVFADGLAAHNSARFVVLGNGLTDGFTGNNYVNNNRIRFVAAVAAGVTNATFVAAESWSFGNKISAYHDLNPAAVTIAEVAVAPGVALFNHDWEGSGADTVTGNTANFLRLSGTHLQITDGFAARPGLAFNSERGLGFFRETAGRLSLSHAGARTYFWTAGQFGVPNGSASVPSITFANDTGLDTGIYAHNTNEIGFSSGGTVKFIVNALGAALPGLPNHANDTAAASGGIPIGGLYRNGNIVQIRVT